MLRRVGVGVAALTMLAAVIVAAQPAAASEAPADLERFMPAGMHLKQLDLTEQDLLDGVVAELGAFVGDRVAAKFTGPDADPILGKGATLACRDLVGQDGKAWLRHHRGFEGEQVHRRVVAGVQTWRISGVRGGVTATELVFTPAAGVACSVTVYGGQRTAQKALRYAGRMVRSGNGHTPHATHLTAVVRSAVRSVVRADTDLGNVFRNWSKVDPEHPATTPCTSDWSHVDWVPTNAKYAPGTKYATVCANKHPHWGHTFIEWRYTCPTTPVVMGFYHGGFLAGVSGGRPTRQRAPLGAYASNWDGIHVSILQTLPGTDLGKREDDDRVGRYAFGTTVEVRFFNPGTSGDDWTWPIFPCMQPNRGNLPD